MFDFLEWYLPWSLIDLPLKVMALIWIVSIVVGICIYVRCIVFKKPWLAMRHMQLSDDKSDQAS